VTSNLRPAFRGWAIVLLGAAVLTLGGCGRKGPLDLPPNASSASVAATSPAPPDTQADAVTKSSVYPSYGAEPAPTAPKGNKKPFVLDPLLDERR
jgi:predicted small lipoprotein YifL